MDKRVQWLSREGFDPETGYTYVYYGQDSYNIKEDLKAAGFRFNKILMWHSASKVENFGEKCFPVHFSEVLQLMAWGEGQYYAEAQKKIKDKINSYLPPSAGNYIKPDDDGKVRVYATCVGKRLIDGQFGPTNIYTFDADGDIIVWYTTTDKINVGDEGNITANFKKNSDFKGIKQTVVNRLKFEN